MATTIEYWEENGFNARPGDEEEDDDDDVPTGGGKERGGAGGARTQGPGLSDLDAKGTVLGRVLGTEDVAADCQAMMLGGELVNCQVDRQKLAENKLMRFVTKLASSAPTKGREKRQVVVAVWG